MTLKYQGILRIFLVALGFSSFFMASVDRRMEMVEDIQANFRNFYAPSEWKRKNFSWDLDAELAKLVVSAKDASLTNDEFQRKIKAFFESTRDYHTRVWFANNGMSTLPISIMNIDDKYYVSYIQKSSSGINLQVGDEIVKFNGENVAQIAMDLIGNIKDPSPTDFALAAKKLTNRSGMSGDRLENGPMIIEALRDGQTIIADLVWNYVENDIHFRAKESKTKRFTLNKDIEDKLGAEIKEYMEEIAGQVEKLNYKYEFFNKSKKDFMHNANNPMALGVKESYLPKLGNIIWQAEDDNPWYAYIYMNEDKKFIGYIRIPHYSPDQPDLYIQKFGEIISKMNSLGTDMLVIDQLNNPGGNVLYLYALASMLTESPLYAPHHQITIDTNDVLEAHAILKTIDSIIGLLELLEVGEFGTLYGYPINIQFFLYMKSFYQFIIKQWDEGKTLTDPHYLLGVNMIRANPRYQYKGKILIAINHLCFSGGDFFPEIVQKNNKVTLIGSTTAGAGGYVLAKNERNRIGILGYTYTGSIALKENGEPLENLGVPPQIKYSVTIDDIKQGFHPFTDVINKNVQDILNKK